MSGTRIAFLRHAPTPWNEAGRLQGRSDIPLSAAGMARAAGWTLPTEMRGWRWACSPLSRARQTATLLGAPPTLSVEPALIEMAFGDWEGFTLSDLRAAATEAVAEREARGLDFAAPGGESPRQAMERLAPWIARVAADGMPTLAVAHKALIRAALAMAFGWDMKGKQPVKLDWSCAHVFRAGADGALTLDRPNVPLR